MDAPTQQVLEMVKQGLPNDSIIEQLQSQGFNFQQISEAIHQAETKSAVEEHSPMEGMQRSALDTLEAPAPSSRPQPRQSMSLSQEQSFQPASNEAIEEIAEAIIEEKWRSAVEEFGDLASFKDKMKMELTSVKQELMRLEQRFDMLQKSVLSKVQDYDTSIHDVGTDIKALEKLLQNLLQPLATNIKELQRLTQQLKAAE